MAGSTSADSEGQGFESRLDYQKYIHTLRFSSGHGENSYHKAHLPKGAMVFLKRHLRNPRQLFPFWNGCFLVGSLAFQLLEVLMGSPNFKESYAGYQAGNIQYNQARSSCANTKH